MKDVLLRIQAVIASLAANPTAFIVVMAFVFGWFVFFQVTGGKFDPNMGIGGFISNAIQLILLFATAALAANTLESTDTTHKNQAHIINHINGRMDSLHQHISTVHSDLAGEDIDEETDEAISPETK